MSFPKPLRPAALVALLCVASTRAIAANAPAAETADADVPSAPAPAKPRPLKRLSDPYARLPAVKLVPFTGTLPPPAPAPAKDTFVLPKMTVTGAPEKTPRLPRIFVHPPVRNVPEPDLPDFESPAARSARLIKKHITPLDQALNGKHVAAANAAAAEAREQSAKQLNSIADLLELSAQLGLDNPEEQKKLRAEYLNVLADRPR